MRILAVKNVPLTGRLPFMIAMRKKLYKILCNNNCTSVLKLSMCISDERTVSSNFDSLMPITAALDNWQHILEYFLENQPW